MEYDLALGPDDYLLLVWFFNLPKALQRPGYLGADVMGYVLRPAGSSEWVSAMRFRYYRDAKAWDSRDKKEWRRGVLKATTEAEAEASTKRLIHGMKLGAAGMFHTRVDPDIFYVRGNADKLEALVIAGRTPVWMHGGEKQT